jgi:hypothetical protein
VLDHAIRALKRRRGLLAEVATLAYRRVDYDDDSRYLKPSTPWSGVKLEVRSHTIRKTRDM